MSHDGSSCKSYIKHPTEKSRLDNLAFTTFPEDYLPYTCSAHRGAPPYLVWGDGDGRPPHRKRRRLKRPSCTLASALGSAIALIVASILAIVAVSVYLGVVTNLFRSPIFSISGRFRVMEGDEFSELLLNTTSYEFLTKAESYKALVEDVFLSSSLEPAFVAARVYAFRRGSVVVYFRVHLDRRKLELDDPETVLVAKNLILEQAIAPRKTFEHLVLDLPSIDVREFEDEEWLSSAFNLFPSATRILEEDSVVKSVVTPEDIGQSATKQQNLHKTPQTSKTDILNSITTSSWRQSGKTRSSLRTTDTPPRFDTTYRNSRPSLVTSTTGTTSSGHLQPEEETQFRYGQWRPIALPGAIQVAQPELSPPEPRKEVRASLGKGTVQLLPDERPQFEEPFLIRSQAADIPVSTKPQQSNVASSIMSSVSLVILPSSRNHSTGVGESVGIGVVQPVNDETDLDVPQMDYVRESRLEKVSPVFPVANNRNDHASLRFIDDEIEHHVDVGDDHKFEESALEYDSSVHESRPLPEAEDHVELLASERPKTIRNDAVVRLFMTPDNKNPSINDSNLVTTENIQIVKTLTGSFSKDPRNEYATTTEKSSNTKVSNEETKILSSPKTEFDNLTEIADSSSQEKVYTLVVDHQESFVSKSTTKPADEVLSIQHETSTPLPNDLLISSGLGESSVSEAVTPVTFFTSFGKVDQYSDKLASTTMKTVSFLKNGEHDDEEESVVTSIDTLLNSFKVPFYDGQPSEFDEFDDFSGFSTFETDLTNGSASLFGTPLSPTQKPIFFDDRNSSPKPGHWTIVNHSQYPTVETEYQTLHTDSTNSTIIESQSSMSVTREDQSVIGVQTSTENFHSIYNTSWLLKNTEERNLTDTKLDSSVSQDGSTVTESEIPSSQEFESNLSTTQLQNHLGFPKIVPPFVDTNYNPNDINSESKKEFDDDEDEFLDRDKFHQTVGLRELTSSSSSGDMNDKDLNSQEEKENDVIRHLTTPMTTIVRPLNNSYIVGLGKHPIFNTHKCQEEEFLCGTGECIPTGYRCNMRRDCRDNSDEHHCPCAEYLAIVGQSQKICDGVKDCWDLSDEQNCPWCSPGQFICPQSRACVDANQVCDGHNDCPYGADERYCVKLAADVASAESPEYKPEGYLMVRKRGHWGKLCLDGLGASSNTAAFSTTTTASQALRWKIEELGRAVCSALTYRELKEAVQTEDKSSLDQFYFQISSNAGPQQKHRSSGSFRPSSCQTKDVVRVKCGSLECGLRPMATSNRRRIVGGQSTGSGSWPWQVALYKEGDFQCGAVLVNSQWLISAGHCFYSTQTAHWTARMGLLRRGTELPSPSEQVRKIVSIILHPDYLDKGFINDIALLRVDRPLPFSDYLRPLCLPQAEEDGREWNGQLCSVVGWGKLFEIGHTFPDSLQEVRLLVISTEECRKRTVFLSMYHITDNMFCAGYERGGRDACLGDSGGPLMCQRQDGRWMLLGVTSNGDGCGRPGRPGVYTKVANYLQWINAVIDNDVLLSKNSTGVVSCAGHRCVLGRCVAPHKVCDGRFDCADGSDEDQCDSLQHP